MGKEDLSKALDEADRANGLEGDAEGIATSAGPEELDRLVEIRRKTLGIPSDLGNKWFRRWNGCAQGGSAAIELRAGRKYQIAFTQRSRQPAFGTRDRVTLSVQYHDRRPGAVGFRVGPSSKFGRRPFRRLSLPRASAETATVASRSRVAGGSGYTASLVPGTGTRTPRPSGPTS